MGSVAGSALGPALLSLDKDLMKKNKKGALIIGGVVGGTLQGPILGSTITSSRTLATKAHKAISPSYDERNRRKLDQLDLAEGKISEEDFIKKHYN